MQAPYKNPYSFADDAIGRLTASDTPTPAPGVNKSYYKAPVIDTPQVSNTLTLPGAAEHSAKGA
jgi:hypothetical protein